MVSDLLRQYASVLLFDLVPDAMLFILLAALLLYKVVPLILGPVLFVIDAPFGRFYSNSRWSMNGMLKLGTLIENLLYEEPISDRSP